MPLWWTAALRGWKPIARDAGLVDEAVGELEAVGLARALARAQLDGDRQAAALARGPRDRDGGVGVLDQRGARAGLADLRHRAAHVQVDEVGAALGDRRPRRSA